MRKTGGQLSCHAVVILTDGVKLLIALCAKEKKKGRHPEGSTGPAYLAQTTRYLGSTSADKGIVYSKVAREKTMQLRAQGQEKNDEKVRR